MSAGPLISVVIPTFNRAHQVQVALKSVLGQTYPYLEVIVVDDGSSDETAVAVQQLIHQNASGMRPVRYLFQARQGSSAARNKGTENARGEWVAFLDSDDVWLPDKLEWQVRAIQQFQGKCLVCVTDARLIDNRGRDESAFEESTKTFQGEIGVDSETAEGLVRTRDPFWVSTLLVQTEAGHKVGWFDRQIEYVEDHDFLFRLALSTPFCYVNKSLALIDRSPSPAGSACRPWDKIDVRLRNSQLMAEKWLKLDDKLSSSVRKTLVQNLRHVHSAWANWYLEQGRFAEARLAISEAVKYEFTPLLAMKWALTRVAPRFAKRFAPRMRVQKL